MHDTRARLDDITGQHRLEGSEDAARCVSCGVTLWRRLTPRHQPGPRTWLQWHAPDGRDWSSFPEGDGWVTYPDAAPSCPPQEVEARCPWEEDARRYGHVWGDVQLETALRTWCGRHEMAVADCPEPGPVCPGWPAHEDGEPPPDPRPLPAARRRPGPPRGPGTRPGSRRSRPDHDQSQRQPLYRCSPRPEPGMPGPCTGRENSCKCMCPACCGDTPDVWGYDGDY